MAGQAYLKRAEDRHFVKERSKMHVNHCLKFIIKQEIKEQTTCACRLFILFCKKVQMLAARSVLKLNLSIDSNNVLGGAFDVLGHVRKDWNKTEIVHKVFDNGITNKLYCFHPKNRAADKVLIRVNGNGTEAFLDRKAEVESFELLHRYNCAPELYCIFNNGLCYEFLPGDTLTTDTVRNPQVFRRLTKELAILHSIPSSRDCPEKPVLFTKMRKFLAIAFSDLTDNGHNTVLLEEKAKLTKEINDLETHLVALDSPVVFCHNDILIHNIIYNSETNKLKFIDYEYAAFNYQGFDIGNHFCEFAGVEDADFSLYPDKELQLTWLRSYLQAVMEIQGPTANGVDEDFEDKINVLYRQVNKFALAAHLFWGIWALVQVKLSKIDFNFSEYSKIRLDEYYKRKEEFLAL